MVHFSLTFGLFLLLLHVYSSRASHTMSVASLKTKIDAQRRSLPSPPSSPLQPTNPPPTSSNLQSLTTFLQTLSKSIENNEENTSPTLNLTSINSKIAQLSQIVLEQHTIMSTALTASEKEWQRQLTQTQQQVIAVTSQFQQATIQLNTYQTQQEKDKTAIQKLEKQLELHSTNNQKQNGTLREQLVQTKQELQQERLKNTNLNKEIQNQTNETTTKNNEIKALQSQLETLQAKLSITQDQFDLKLLNMTENHAQTLQTKEKEFNKEKELTKRLQLQLKEVTNQLQLKVAESNTYTASLQQNTNATDTIQKTLLETQEKLHRSEKGRINSVNIQTGLRKKLKEFERNLEISKNSIETLQVSIQEQTKQQKQTIQEHAAIQERQLAEITTATARAETSEHQVTTMTLQMKEMEIKLVSLDKSSTTTNDQINNYQNQVLELNISTKKNRDQITVLNQTITELNANKQKLTTKINQDTELAKNQFNTLSKECRTAVTAREVLSKRHELLEQSMEEIQLKLKESTLAYNSREEVLSKQEKELRAAIAKLSKTLDTCEGEITCMHCLKVFVEPSTVIRTGETFCTKCYQTGTIEGYEDVTEEVVKIKRFETMSAKFSFMKQALAGLKKKCDER